VGSSPGGERSGYRRELGLWHLVWLAVGAILGPAVAFVPVAVLASGGPLGLVAWLIGFAALIPTALVFAELGTMWPRAGGVAYYPAKSHGSVVGLLNGWGAFLGYTLIVPASTAAVVETLAYYYPSLYNGVTLTWVGIALAIVIAVAAFAVDALRVIVLGNLNTALTIFKIAAVVAASAALLLFFRPSNFTSYGGVAPMGAKGLFAATTATIFAYLGFRQPVDYAEEARRPERDIPLAMTFSLVFVLVIYVLQSLSFLGVVDRWSSFNITAGNWTALANLAYPFPAAASAVGLPAMADVFVIGAVVAAATDALIYMGGAARVGNALARLDNYFPEFFARLSRHGIPFNSLLVVLAVGLAYLLLLPSFYSVMNVFTDAVLISYAPAAASLAVFRATHPAERRPFRLPAYRALAPIAFAASSLLIYWSGLQAVEVTVLSTLASLLLLPYVARRGLLSRKDLRAGAWMIAWLLLTLLLSYLGSFGVGIIPSPYDTLLYLAVSLAVFYWAVRSGLEYNGLRP
jgi:amino acid transporter